LLHGNGTNGSTTITDNSPSPKTVTVVGNAQISTAQSKFGGSSIAFDGSGDYLRVSNNQFNVGSSDFTVEGWIYFNNGSENADRIIYTNYDTIFLPQTTPVFFGKHSNAGGKVVVYLYPGAPTFFSESTLPPSNQWLHYALVKAGNSYSIYRDGTQTATASFSGLSHTTSLCTLGGFDPTNNHNGYIDDLRITKGVARYTANFTPPAAPFPDI
jgi:hypothetical protein